MSTELEEWRQAWLRNWPGTRPEAHRLKWWLPERWVRFHALPDSKRYPEDEAEYRTVLERHHTVLEELAGGQPLLLVTIARGAHDHPRRTSALAHAVPPARRWWTFEASDSEPDWPQWCSAFISRISDPRAQLEGVLRLVADDREGGVIIAPQDFRWLFHPYDGGADVLLPGTAERDALRERHGSWLSSHPEGL